MLHFVLDLVVSVRILPPVVVSAHSPCAKLVDSCSVFCSIKRLEEVEEVLIISLFVDSAQNTIILELHIINEMDLRMGSEVMLPRKVLLVHHFLSLGIVY